MEITVKNAYDKIIDLAAQANTALWCVRENKQYGLPGMFQPNLPDLIDQTVAEIDKIIEAYNIVGIKCWTYGDYYNGRIIPDRLCYGDSDEPNSLKFPLEDWRKEFEAE